MAKHEQLKQSMAYNNKYKYLAKVNVTKNMKLQTLVLGNRHCSQGHERITWHQSM